MRLLYTSLGRRFRITRGEKTSAPKRASIREAASRGGKAVMSWAVKGSGKRVAYREARNVMVTPKLCKLCTFSAASAQNTTQKPDFGAIFRQIL
jgi:hypothetical protein